MLEPGDRVRALVAFGDKGEPDYVPAGELGTVVRPSWVRRAYGCVYVAFDVDPDDLPWRAAAGEVERVRRARDVVQA